MSNTAVKYLPDSSNMAVNSVWRKDLLAKIENMPAGTVLLCSMAGYGKSTLLSQLSLRNQPVAFCQLGQYDNDLSFFLGHLSASMPGTTGQGDSGTGEHPMTKLWQIGRTALAGRMTLIFDNCQVVSNGEVCRALQFLMAEAEKGFKVVLSSRTLPGFAARFILEERCLLLRRDDLALSETEIGELVKNYLGKENPQLARDLYDFTGGWAAGVIFCLRHQENMAGKEPAWEEMADRGLIRKYITFEICPDLPEHVAQFARRASMLDLLSAEVCDTILETGDARESLGFLAENEVFLHPCPDEPKTFKWIAIFRKALQEELAVMEKAAIAEKTIEYYLRRRMHREAIDFALHTGKPDLVSRALSRCGESLLEEGQFELWGACARLLEKGGEKLDAALHRLLAQYYYVAGDYAKMDHHFNMADSMFGKENIYSIQRTLYRALLRYETDPPKYLKMINNVLFYLEEYNLKLPFLQPREQQLLDRI